MTERPQTYEMIRNDTRVAWVVVFPDNTTVTHWCVEDMPASTAVWRYFHDAARVHSHDGDTTFVAVP